MTPDHEREEPTAERRSGVAVVGLAGRFPGARDVATFWTNLRAGTESISRFSAADLIAEGRAAEEVTDPRFVGAEGLLDEIDLFDAAFFGYSPAEAAVMDPQHRLGLEVAWHALEDAACDPSRHQGAIGVFLGTALSSYLIRNLLPDQNLLRRNGGFPLLIHNDKDFAATTLAHKLRLTGPAMAVGTACSSSLVAVHLACQSLESGECDLALAGGSSIQVPQRQGYIHDGAGIYSYDGWCRPFDAKASGTVGGSAVAMVVLKRLEDAWADGDRIHAVIAGTAVNNDGGSSAGYTAPGVEGQAAVVAEALAVAGVEAPSIGLVETHGTGTLLGDAVEIDALTKVFEASPGGEKYCALGSLKANVGHLDTAAGVAGLIKAVLCVEHGVIPPHPTFATPNPHIDWDRTPFHVNVQELSWPADRPRRAGVSSFGIGGTNAHVIVEQAPAAPGRPAGLLEPTWQLLAVSAADSQALVEAMAHLAERVQDCSPAELMGVCRTLARRREFRWRHIVVARSGPAAAIALRAAAAAQAGQEIRENAVIAALSPPPNEDESDDSRRARLEAMGQAWAAGARVDLDALILPGTTAADCPPYPFRRRRHWTEPPTRKASAARSDHDIDALARLADVADRRLTELSITDPIRGMASYPGLRESLDELCAAISLQYLTSTAPSFAIGRRCERSRLIEELGVLPPYRPFVDYQLALLLEDGILGQDGESILRRTAPHPTEVQEVAARIQATFPGFSGLVDLLTLAGSHYPRALSVPGAALETLYPGGGGDLLRDLLGARTTNFSVTGHLLDALTAVVPHITTATSGRPLKVLEVGAGTGRLTWQLAPILAGRKADFTVTDIGRLFVQELTSEGGRRGLSLSVRRLDISQDPVTQGFAAGEFDLVVGLDVVHATPDVSQTLSHLHRLLAPGGVLAMVETVSRDRWLSMIWGLSAEWWGFTDDRELTPIRSAAEWPPILTEAGFNVLPVVPPQDEPDSVLLLARADTPSGAGAPAPLAALPGKRPDPADWCYLPAWRAGTPIRPGTRSGDQQDACLVFTDSTWGDDLAEGLRRAGIPVVAVRSQPVTLRPGEAPGSILSIEEPDDYAVVVRQLTARRLQPRYVLHLWNARPGASSDLSDLAESQELGLFSLLRLARALASQSGNRPTRLLAVTCGAQDVLGGELSAPERATVHAAVKVIPLEYPNLSCSSLDIPAPEAPGDPDWLADRIMDELLTEPLEPVAAYRGRRRWVPSYVPWRLPPASPATPRPGGTYLVCGGLGGIGLGLARYLGGLPARIAVLRRSPFPGRDGWDEWSRSHPPDDPTSTAIRVLREVEALGGEVMVLRADVSDLNQMRAAVHAIGERFGPLDGVIHAAGVRDTAGIIQRRSDEATWQAMSAKLVGPFVLQQVLGDHRPDFVAYCSSIGTVLHKLKFGEVGYVAGNEVLNAWAASQSAAGWPGALSIAWTDWLEAGMWQDSQAELTARYSGVSSADLNGFDPAHDLLRGLTTAEALEVFHRLLAAPPGSQAVVSTQDLDALLTRHAAFSRADHLEVLDAVMRAAESRARPHLPTPYVPARTELERAATAVWSSVLGIDDIGLDDDFFTLGGDSLIALRLLARLQESTGLDRTITDLFRDPTPAGLLAASPAEQDEQDEPGDDGEEVIFL